MVKKRTYTEEEFISAVTAAFSIRQVLITLGLKPAGGNYALAKRRMKRLNLDTSHFTGQGHLKGKTHNWSPRKPLIELLVENSTYTTGSLKRRLIKEGIKESKCEWCNITEWRGIDVSLELDHINGISDDHRLENLRILCPNCHSQTPTYRGRNIGKGESMPTGRAACLKNTCGDKTPIVGSNPISPTKCICGATIHKNSAKCRTCSYKMLTKIAWPPTQILEQLVRESSYVAVGQTLNVSDTAVRNRIKNHK